jgi:uncharacterized protein (TIGR04551 family)
VASQTDNFNRRVGGQPWDIDDGDDVSQWTVMISRMDTPLEFQETLDRGELGLNYGAYFVYRTQQNDYNPASLDPETETEFGTGQLGEAANPNAYVLRDYKSYTLDGWLHFAWDKLDIQIEGAAILGHIGNVSDIAVDLDPNDNDTSDVETNPNRLDIRSFGGVFRLTHRSFEDKLKLGFEVGTASGDEWDNLPAGNVHISNARPIPGPNDHSINNFYFNQDYEIDLILFRELIGTVTNATYLRPSLSYALTKDIGFRGQSVISFANEPVATPGNGGMWGVEFDGDVGYNTDTFSAGIAYGVLFPLSALSHPEDVGGETSPQFGYGANIGDATTAHTIQTRLSVKF